MKEVLYPWLWSLPVFTLSLVFWVVFVDDDYDDYDDEGSEKEKYKKEREDEYGVCYLVAKAERKKHVRIKVLQST